MDFGAIFGTGLSREPSLQDHHPHGKKLDPPKGRCWGATEPEFIRLRDVEKKVYWPKGGDGRPRIKQFPEDQKGLVPDTLWLASEVGDTEASKKLLLEIFSDIEIDFHAPKPIELVERCIAIAAGEDALILDSFAGSGTTAQAVLAANSRDEGSRRFILIECEEYADTLTAERVRRVIDGYSFKGTQSEELHREPVTFTKLKNASGLLEKVQQIETLDGPKFNRIKSTVKDGVLIVTGEKDCKETAPGLGGKFTYCTLGDAIDMDGLLTGQDLPAVESLAALLYHSATAKAFDPSSLSAAPEIGEGAMSLGEEDGRHLWLFYKPDLEWLKSAEAALTLSRSRAIAASQTGDHLVFAPAKFVSRELLAQERLPVEYAPLPFALYRVETA